MPELPEVETVVCGLRQQMVGQQIRDVVLNRPDMRFPFPPDFQERLIGARVSDVRRRAKYLLFELDSDDIVLAHLGMSGTMTLRPCLDYVSRKHDHVLWELSDDRFFVFHDPRRFGFMLLTNKKNLSQHPQIAALGPEPLSDAFDAAYLKAALKGRKTAIKPALMDQKLVVGVGNIYASEALFLAGINPFMEAGEAARHAEKIIKMICLVLQEAIASGGSTLRDYVRSDGDMGYFQHHFRVYGRAKEPCEICETMIEKVTQAQRATYFCKQCQKVK